MRAVVDARPTEALKAPGAWGLGWPNCRNCRFAGTAVTLAGLAQSAAAQQVFHADQKFMLAAAAPARSVPPVCVPLVLVALNGDTHPLTDWHVNDPVTIDLELAILDMDWSRWLDVSTQSSGDAPFQIVLDDEAADGTVSGKFATVQDQHNAVGTLLAQAEPPRAVLVWDQLTPTLESLR